MPPRVLVGSNYNDGMRLFNALPYELCKVIAQCNPADLLAPRGIRRSEVASTIASKGTRLLSRSRPSNLEPVEISQDYDVFFYVCMTPNGLADLQSFQGWRKRSRKCAAFIFETWSSWLRRERRHLKALDEFDHVFVFNRASLPNLQRYTSAPCTFLPAGTDCIAASPYPLNPRRVIDVYSMGRRSEDNHRQFLEMAEASEIFYVFDPEIGTRVFDFEHARILTLNMIKRSRYFIAYDLSVGPKGLDAGGEQALPARLFEGAAGGAVMLGSTPRCPEFEQLFDWPDALIEIPVESGDVRAEFRRIETDPGRLARASFLNATQSLRRHDWVYRWEHVINTLGLDASEGMERRKLMLSDLADCAQAAEESARSA
jgi:hypothetical protein